jgi:glycosyltransferase involved in cell wall biosynthesis
MSTPLVTVLLDTYNHERFIEEAIVSVLEQDFLSSDMEILVVDDGSTDRTPEIVSKFAPRVRLLRKANGGQASAFNAGIAEARGEIVAFLDGDDWWARNKLTRVMEAISADPAVGIVGHGIVIAYLDGSEQSESLRDGFRFRADTVEGAFLLRRRGAFLGTSRMTIRTALLRNIGTVPEALQVQADEYLYTLASVLSSAQILPENLTFYRLHESNGFHNLASDSRLVRRKQLVLAALFQALDRELRARQFPPELVKAIVDIIQAQADQLRLMIDGGWPWETVKTEHKIYEVFHPEASLLHRFFKSIALLAAAAMPPKVYYAAQHSLSKSNFYLRARGRWLPFPDMPHLEHGTNAAMRSADEHREDVHD